MEVLWEQRSKSLLTAYVQHFRCDILDRAAENLNCEADKRFIITCAYAGQSSKFTKDLSTALVVGEAMLLAAIKNRIIKLQEEIKTLEDCISSEENACFRNA